MRARTRKAVIFVMATLLMLTACSREQADEAASETARQELPSEGQKEAVRWHSFNEGLAKARRENKAVLIDFYTDWCVYCKKLEKETLGHQQVSAKLSANFVAIRLNAERTAGANHFRGQTFTDAELSRYFGVRAYPTMAFLDSTGKPITIIPGYVPPKPFLALLNYIHLKCYETEVTFAEFVERGDCT